MTHISSVPIFTFKLRPSFMYKTLLRRGKISTTRVHISIQCQYRYQYRQELKCTLVIFRKSGIGAPQAGSDHLKYFLTLAKLMVTANRTCFTNDSTRCIVVINA